MDDFKSIRRDYNTHPLTDEDIFWAYKKIAKLIQLHGNAYMPIFERFHTEVEKIKKRKTMEDIVKKVADENYQL